MSLCTEIVRRLTHGTAHEVDGQKPLTFDSSDDERGEIINFIDTLDERVFSKTSKKAWKLRMFFKPSDVVSYLVSRGISHRLFSQSK